MTETKRGTYSSPRQVERRLRILRATGEYLESQGLDALSMGIIAERSQVSVKTLYNLFGSRDRLLLEAAASVLSNLGESERVRRAEPGIPRLLAYVVGSMESFVEAPTYARAIISTLIKADLEPELADQHMGVVRRYAQSALGVAQAGGELRTDLVIERAAEHISANQWGAVVLWEKGLLPVARLPVHVALSHYMTLTPLCRGQRRAIMETEFERLLSSEGVSSQ